MNDRDDTFTDPTRAGGAGGEPAEAVGAGDLEGRLLDGRYRIERKLGEGGMATVWLARDEKPGMGLREVAVKVPHPALLASPQARERFEREVRSLLRTEHPGVVRIYDVGRWGVAPYLVMQYLSGGNLSGRLRAVGGRQEPADAAAWLRPLSRVLDALHADGLVHRDVKPDNVLFDARGQPCLADFGISKALEAGDGTLTGTGVALGSVRTMAPEQCLGGEITGMADQYALASTLYEALAGQPVFAGENVVRVLTRKVSQDAPSLQPLVPGLPAAAVAAVMRGLAREPTDRHASCEALAQAFGRALAAVPAGVTAVLQDAAPPSQDPAARPSEEARGGGDEGGGSGARPQEGGTSAGTAEPVDPASFTLRGVRSRLITPLQAVRGRIIKSVRGRAMPGDSGGTK